MITFISRDNVIFIGGVKHWSHFIRSDKSLKITNVLIGAPISTLWTICFKTVFLPRQSLVAVGKVDDAAVGEPVLQDVVLHDAVVAVRVDADVALPREAELHDILEDAVCLRETRDAVDDVVRLCVIKPLAVVDPGVRGLRTWQEREVGHNAAGLLNHVTARFRHVRPHNLQRGIAVVPLAPVAVSDHYGPGSSENLQEPCRILRQGDLSDGAGFQCCVILHFRVFLSASFR